MDNGPRRERAEELFENIALGQLGFDVLQCEFTEALQADLLSSIRNAGCYRSVGTKKRVRTSSA